MNDMRGLGGKVRMVRNALGLTLAAMADRTGFSISALSKMENNQSGLTYDKLIKVSAALGVDIGSFFIDTPQVQVTARRSVARRGEGRAIETGFYDYLYFSPELKGKRIVPILGKAHARSLEEFGSLVRHEGEEWIYVLNGRLEIHTEFYETVALEPGDSVYLDSGMGHAYISLTDGGADFLAICSAPAQELMDEAKRLAELTDAVRRTTKVEPI